MLLFGDQSSDYHQSILHLHQRASSSPAVATFLDSAHGAIRDSLRNLTPSDQKRLSYNGLLELSEQQSSRTVKDPAAYTVLSCVAQLGHALLYTQSHPEIWSLKAEPATGICTGVFAAVALQCSDNENEFLRWAPRFVSISLKAGLFAGRRAEAIDQDAGSWASSVFKISQFDLQRAIDTFVASKHLPAHRRPYISAIFPSSLTVSGPPSILEDFFATANDISRVELMLGAPFHADHLSIPNIEDIIGPEDFWYQDLKRHRPIISSCTGHVLTDIASVSMILERVLVDIFQQPIDVTALCRGLKEQLITVINIVGPSKVTSTLRSSLPSVSVEQDEFHTPSENPQSDRIVIVGMSGRFPGADNVDELWDLLMEGKDMCREIPKDRFDVATHVDPSGQKPNTSLTPFGCFVESAGLFDNQLFRMSPREAAQTDPMQRLMLLTAYEALQMSGYNAEQKQTDTFATFYGTSSDDWREVNAGQDIDFNHITGGNRAFGPGRLNYHFKWDGPSAVVDTACSASAVAIEMACDSLRLRKCDVALAGGANIMTASDIFAGLSRANFLSPTGSCKTWDEGADGYCRADAVCTIVLKREVDALRSGDNILAVVAAARTNHSATASSITHPDDKAQQQLLRQVLRDANLRAADIDVVEAHGTGTQAGDCNETRALFEVFGDSKRQSSLYLGSVKANIGHGGAASGVSSVIKGLMMLKHGTIPRHIGIKSQRNPKLPLLESGSIEIPLQHVPFTGMSSPTLSSFEGGVLGAPLQHMLSPAKSKLRRILVNNFNATGGNSSIILEDYRPAQHRSETDVRSHHLVVVSGASSRSCNENLRHLAEYVRTSQGLDVASLAYTTTARSQHHDYRQTFAVESLEDFLIFADQTLASEILPKRVPRIFRVGFAFTGQSSQYIGMGQDLFHTNHMFKNHINQLDLFCRLALDLSFLPAILGEAENAIGPAQMQLALAALQIALATVWRSWGIEPTAVIGHSLGEYAALCIAGVLGENDTLYLVGLRALLMERKLRPGQGMLAISCPANLAEALISACAPDCSISCYNTNDSVVVAGSTEQLLSIKKLANERGIPSTTLQVPYAYHSSQMDLICSDFAKVCQHIKINPAKVPVISTLTATTIAIDESINPEYFVRHMRDPVQFSQALEQASRDTALDAWIEIGPHPTCLAMIATKYAKALLVPSLRRGNDSWKILSQSLGSLYTAGASLSWNSFHAEYRTSLKLIDLPKYAFDLKKYWLQYEGDWSVTKHRGQKSVAPSFEAQKDLSISLHRFTGKSVDSGNPTWTFESSLASPAIRKVVKGHVVHDSYLCPASVYSEMGFTAGQYVLQELGDQQSTIEINNVDISKPLILDEESQDQVVKVEATKIHTGLNVQISSTKSGILTKHATFNVVFAREEDWHSSWLTMSYLISDRAKQIMQSDQVNRMMKPLAYKLFSSFVNYSEDFQGMDEVYLHSDSLEASAKITLRHFDEVTTFHPCWTDSIGHLTGFVVNSHGSPDTGYIAQGWKRLRISRAVKQGSYIAHVRMQPVGTRGKMQGDIFLLDNNTIVASYEGVQFQAIKKSILSSLMPVAKPSTATPGPAISAAPVATKTNFRSSHLQSQTQPAFDLASLIAAETGIDKVDIDDSSHFKDLGIDSLMIIALLGKVQETYNVCLSPACFDDHPTVGQLSQHIKKATGSVSSLEPPGSSASSKSFGSSTSLDSGTPVLTSKATSVASVNVDSNTARTVLSIIAREVGCSESDLQSSAFDELGVDSLMTLSILDAVATELDLRLPSSFFYDNPTYKAITSYFETKEEIKQEEPSQSKLTTSNAPKLSCRAYQLQSGSGPTLYLLPDGSGCAASYLQMTFSPTWNVIALDSPLLGSSSTALDLPAVVSSYTAAILARKDSHPVHLGGWSIGGTYAYEAASQLLALGHRVESLQLLDAPCPRNIQPLPLSTVALLEQAGHFGGKAHAGKIRDHFRISVKLLEDYRPLPLPVGIKARIIWAKRGVADADRKVWDPLIGDRKEMHETQKWLLLDRQDVGPNGWEGLLPGVECEVVEGTHFDFVKLPLAKKIGLMITR